MVAWGVRAQAEYGRLAQLKRQRSEVRKASKLEGQSKLCRSEYQRRGIYVEKELKNP